MILLALAACNRVFGVEDTTLRDAPPPPPPDAPFQCPAAGATPIAPPVFNTGLVRATSQMCANYSQSASARLEVALCQVGSTTSWAQRGFDEPAFQPIQLANPNRTPSMASNTFRLAADGDELFIDETGGTLPIGVYHRDSATSTSWTWEYDLPRTDAFAVATSGVTRRGSAPRHYLGFFTTDRMLHEYVETAPGTWQDAMQYGPTDLGVGGFSTVPVFAFTGDGLRLVFIAKATPQSNGYSTFYTDRDRLDVPLRPGVMMAISSPPTQPFLTDDCGRLYFDNLGAIYFVQQ